MRCVGLLKVDESRHLLSGEEHKTFSDFLLVVHQQSTEAKAIMFVLFVAYEVDSIEFVT